VAACVGLGLRLRQPRRPGGRERACNHPGGPPKRAQRGDQRRPKEMHRLHQISARAPSSHTVAGWTGGCAVIGRAVPCCRSRRGLFSENLGPPCHWHF
jgi:hypothetical protein